MASIYFKRLEKKYGKTKLRGAKYQALINDILVHNNTKMSGAVLRLSDNHYKTSMKKLSKAKQKTVKLPDVSEVFPKRSVFLIKAAESGKSISDTLRTQLEKNMRDTLKKYTGKGLPKMETQRGVATGKINTNLIKEFQTQITKTFESRTKRDPKTGIPPNIKAIATTEIRSTVNSLKGKYNTVLLRENPHLKMVKTWKHNRQLSKVPRPGHMQMNDVTEPAGTKFKVPMYVKIKGKNIFAGWTMMDRPHDPKAPPEQIISCSCDILYKAQLP